MNLLAVSAETQLVHSIGVHGHVGRTGLLLHVVAGMLKR